MDILGLDPVLATLVFTGVGLGLQNIVGWLKDKESFDIRKAAASGIIAFFGSSLVIGGVIGALPADADPLSIYSVIATSIATVAGFDALLKNGAKAVTKS